MEDENPYDGVIGGDLEVIGHTPTSGQPRGDARDQSIDEAAMQEAAKAGQMSGLASDSGQSLLSSILCQ